MKENEAMILSNQGLIMTALAFLVKEPLRDTLLEGTNRTVKYLEKEIGKLNNEAKKEGV